MISYLGSLVQLSPAMWRAGRCRQIRCVWGALAVFRPHWVCPTHGVSVLSPSTLLRLPPALYGAGPVLSAVPVFGSSTKALIWLRLHFVPSPRLCGSGSQRLAGTLPGCSACHEPFPSAAPARSRSGLRKSLDRNRGLFAVLEGVVSRAEFAPFPSPLPPSSSGDGPALLWSFSVPLFCETRAVCSGRLIFSLAVPQFIKAPSDCSQGLRAGPYPKQCRPLLSVPPPRGGCRRLGYFSARSCF